MLAVMGGLLILVPQLLIWSQAQAAQFSIFKNVDPELENALIRFKMSLLPLKYIGILFLGGAAGLLVSPRLNEE